MKKKVFAVLIATLLLCACLPLGAVSATTEPAAAEQKTYRYLTYVVTEEGAYITGCDKNVTEVVIPRDIDGMPVYGIGSGAFADCKKLTTIIFYRYIQDIANGAFAGCDALHYVYYRGPQTEEDVCFSTDELWGAMWIYEIAGDLNGDGELSNRDQALLQQYINGWDVEINEILADLDGDGDVNNRDLAQLQRRLNGTENDDVDSFFNDGSFGGWEQMGQTV